jgi:predicted NACHT family NTPase
MWAGALPPDGREIPVDVEGAEGERPCDLLARGRPVVILGGPGAGKSTLLLRVFSEWPDSESVPVPLHFASWPVRLVRFEEWLAGELTGPLYGLPKGVAEWWISDGRVVPLLDGVDELPVDQGRACLRALASYARRKQVPYAVCCRTSSYTALATALRSPGVVTLRPLDNSQISSYLEKAGVPGLRDTAEIRNS